MTPEPLDAVMSSPVLSDGADELSFLDESFTDESRKDSFNKSMSSISSEWTPIKYQLRTDFNSLAKKTQKQLVRKSLIAVDNELNNIAPGQVDQPRKSITQKPTYSSEIKKALQDAVSRAWYPGQFIEYDDETFEVKIMIKQSHPSQIFITHNFFFTFDSQRFFMPSYIYFLFKVYVNFLDRPSSDAKSFVWPALDKKMEEDKCWVKEGKKKQ